MENSTGGKSGDTMTENEFPGPMTMVRIDGAKIKRIRERQGLTQLYLATAVEVTTDTISRWENRRYPTIKKENGLKLAEALNVELNELLEEEVPASHPGEGGLSADAAGVAQPKRTNPSLPAVHRRIWPLLLLSATLGLVLLGFLFALRPPPPQFAVTVKRVLPPHATLGQPFPVLLEILGDPDRTTTLIIKENLPAGTSLLQTSPPQTAGGGNSNQLKWLKKINGTTVFAYLVSVAGVSGQLQFNGSAAVSSNPESSLTISGMASVNLGEYHWADANRDHSISDDEILAVYDRYGDLAGIDLDLDQVEEIWLGSGYTWNSATASFEIRD
jgi:transcriptional regulator with XRE-family HTH domain